MKSLTRIALISFLVISFISSVALAETKTFIKEYTYKASDEDSKHSSRVIALREIKTALLEELGTYLESKTEVKNFQLTLDQITTLTAGIVQTELVNETWDGKKYWLNVECQDIVDKKSAKTSWTKFFDNRIAITSFHEHLNQFGGVHERRQYTTKDLGC
jgi:hypothetical protein